MRENQISMALQIAKHFHNTKRKITIIKKIIFGGNYMIAKQHFSLLIFLVKKYAKNALLAG